MEEKSSPNKDVTEKSEESKMECEDIPEDTESAEVSKDSALSDKIAAGEKSSTSVMSESTSDIEMASRSTSTSDPQCEGVETSDKTEKLEPSPITSESTSGVDMSSRSTSESDPPCEATATLLTETDKPEQSPKLSEPTSGPDMRSSDSERPCERMATSDIPPGGETSPKVPESTPGIAIPKSASETKCEGIETSGGATENTNQMDTSSASPPQKKSFFTKVKHFLSPPKSGKTKVSRSKSMSPPEKIREPEVEASSASAETSASAEASVETAAEGEETTKKGKEKSGLVKTLKKGIKKIGIGSKSSDSKNLVSDEETEQPQQTEEKDALSASVQWSELCTCKDKPRWTANRTSLTENQSLGGTTMTDVPSTSSCSDVFTNDTSRKPSNAGEDTSEEAVAASLDSSPDGQIPDIQQDKQACENLKEESSVENEEQGVEVAEDVVEKQSNPQEKDGDDEKPEN